MIRSDSTQLRMPRPQRLAVGFLFSLGFIVTVAGIVRTWYIYRSLFNEWDQTWYSYPLWIAAAVEIDLGVVRYRTSYLRILKLTYPPDMRIGASTSAIVVENTYQFFRNLLAQQVFAQVLWNSVEGQLRLIKTKSRHNTRSTRVGEGPGQKLRTEGLG